MEMKVNHNTIQNRGIKIHVRVSFDFHNSELFILTPNNPNTLTNSIFILYFNVANMI